MWLKDVLGLACDKGFKSRSVALSRAVVPGLMDSSMLAGMLKIHYLDALCKI